MNKLSVSKINELTNIFQEQNWSISKDENHQFERFSKSLGYLEPEDQEFILKITRYYRQYSVSHYENMLKECLETMNKAGIFNTAINNFIVAPLLPYITKEDMEENKKLRRTNKTKSSNLMCYLMKSNQLSYLSYLNNVNLEVYSYLEEENFEQLKNNEVKLILMDDFIGSGKTATTSIHSFVKKGIDPSNIIVVSLIIDKKGEELIKKTGVNYFSSQSEYYTISDIFKEEENQYINKRLLNIVQKVGAKQRYMFGYGETGSLLSLIRTPNNTVPFYWFEGNFSAPFPRFRE